MALLEPYLSSSAQGKLNLQGAEIDFAWSNNIVPPDIPSRFTAGDVIGPVDFLGWDNPRCSVNGIFDAVDSPTFFSTLKEFAKNTSSVYLYDPVFLTSGTQIVRIQQFTCKRSSEEGRQTTGSDIVKGSIVQYSMDFILSE